MNLQGPFLNLHVIDFYIGRPTPVEARVESVSWAKKAHSRGKNLRYKIRTKQMNFFCYLI